MSEIIGIDWEQYSQDLADRAARAGEAIAEIGRLFMPMANIAVTLNDIELENSDMAAYLAQFAGDEPESEDE